MDKQIEITNTEHGYNHDRLSGTCGPDVTVKDIEERFFHSYSAAERHGFATAIGAASCTAATDPITGREGR